MTRKPKPMKKKVMAGKKKMTGGKKDMSKLIPFSKNKGY